MTAPFDETQLRKTLLAEPFTATCRALTRFLREEYSESDPFVLLAAALCQLAAREGHSYLDLSAPPLPETLHKIPFPDTEEWSERFSKSRSVGDESDETPLVFREPNALYLRKYFVYEKQLAAALARKAGASQTKPMLANEASTEEADLQKQAVSGALQHSLFLISGGPGTGKTTTVLDYLIQALASWESPRPCRIAAVAPTGKAAARLSESLLKGLSRFEIDAATDELIRKIPCMTLHRLLQSLPGRSSFRRNRDHPIDCDILVVDESSMIDLPLMQKLFDAIPDNCSVALLGDQNQLASVEVGSVFGDLLRSTHDPSSPLFGKSVTLEKTYRFSEDSSIFQFCETARNGDSDQLASLLTQTREDFEFSVLKGESPRDLKPIIDQIVAAHEQRLQSPDLESAFESLSRFIALTPFNQGVFGSLSINRRADQLIRQRSKFDTDEPYKGMPLIVLENNYDLELFNGDIGIIWPDPATGEKAAWFANPDGPLKRVRLNWLPKHEAAYCLTIHKSQGSEFDHVLGIFSPEDNEFITRELVYTCASRAKQRLSLYGSQSAMKQSIQRSATRATRLEQRILESAASPA